MPLVSAWGRCDNSGLVVLLCVYQPWFTRSCVVVQGDSASASLEAASPAGVASPDRISSGGSDNDEADTYVVFYGGCGIMWQLQLTTRTSQCRHDHASIDEEVTMADAATTQAAAAPATAPIAAPALAAAPAPAEETVAEVDMIDVAPAATAASSSHTEAAAAAPAVAAPQPAANEVDMADAAPEAATAPVPAPVPAAARAASPPADASEDVDMMDVDNQQTEEAVQAPAVASPSSAVDAMQAATQAAQQSAKQSTEAGAGDDSDDDESDDDDIVGMGRRRRVPLSQVCCTCPALPCCLHLIPTLTLTCTLR